MSLMNTERFPHNPGSFCASFGALHMAWLGNWFVARAEDRMPVLPVGWLCRTGSRSSGQSRPTYEDDGVEHSVGWLARFSAG